LKLGRYALRRVLLSIPVLVGVSLVTFGINWVANDGELWRAYDNGKLLPEQRAQLIRNGGFDRPWYLQYFSFLNRLAHLDLGLSHAVGDRPIVDVLHAFFPPTLELTVVAMAFAVAAGLALGALSGVSLPIFWLGLILKFTFATTFPKTIVLGFGWFGKAFFLFATLGFLGAVALVAGDLTGLLPSRRAAWAWTIGGAALAAGVVAATPLASPAIAFAFDHVPHFPLGGRFSNDLLTPDDPHPSLTGGPTNVLMVDTLLARDWVAFKDVVWHLVLPAVTLGYASMAIITRMMRSSMLETLSQDYVRTARAKGLSEGEVLRRHARRNALIPTSTVIGLAFGGLLGGAVLTETIFQWPGLGRWSTDAIVQSDTNSIVAFTMLVTLVYLVVNLVVDVAYAMLDPRVRLE
jgi:peptide/nickel transport system permease protein